MLLAIFSVVDSGSVAAVCGCCQNGGPFFPFQSVCEEDFDDVFDDQ